MEGRRIGSSSKREQWVPDERLKRGGGGGRSRADTRRERGGLVTALSLGSEGKRSRTRQRRCCHHTRVRHSGPRKEERKGQAMDGDQPSRNANSREAVRAGGGRKSAAGSVVNGERVEQSRPGGRCKRASRGREKRKVARGSGVWPGVERGGGLRGEVVQRCVVGWFVSYESQAKRKLKLYAEKVSNSVVNGELKQTRECANRASTREKRMANYHEEDGAYERVQLIVNKSNQIHIAKKQREFLNFHARGNNGDDDAIDDEVETRQTEPRNCGISDRWNIANNYEISDNQSRDF
nr:hypothetical protein Iba_chr11cCG6790 [Ipomoea batatas]